MDLEHPVKVVEPRRRGRPPKHPPSSPDYVPRNKTSNGIQLQSTRSGRQVKVPLRYISVLGGVV